MGEWLVEPGADRVRQGAFEARVRPRVMDLLVYLAGRSGEVVTKGEILDAVWTTRIVAESALTSALAEMRQALGDDPKRPWLLETIPKRGYRFLPRPRAVNGDGAPVAEARGAPAPWAEGVDAVFVGRRAERERLLDAFRAARAGRGRALFVAGEAGSGKTALLAEHGRRVLAELPDVAVAGGRCPFHEGPAEPFAAFRELLRVLSGDPDGGWLPRGPDAQPADVAEWGRILREVVLVHGPALQGTLLPGPVPPHPPGVEALSGQLVATLRAFAERIPLVLLLDDLHRASRGTVALLYQLARCVDRTRILLVGAFRPEELARAGGVHPLEQAVDELVRYGGEAVLDLGDGGGRAFLDALVDSVPNRLDEGFRRELLSVTEGQPLLTIETLRGLHARGALARDADGLWTSAGAIPWGGLPTRVEALVRERVESLDAAAREVLEMAAVEGEEFLAEVVAEALRAPLPRVVETLSGVLGRQRRLVSFPRPVTIGGRRFSLYRFRHALFRRRVYERLDSAQLSSRHDRLAEARRAFPEAAAGERDAALARHLERGRRPAQAAPFRIAAADRALSAGAPVEALAGYEAACALLEADESLAHRGELLRRAVSGRASAAALLEGQGSAAVGEALARLHGLCAEAGDEPGRLAAAVRLAGHHGARGEPGLSVRVARRAADDAERLGLAGLLAAARATLAIADTVSGRLADAEKSFEDAEEARAAAPENVPAGLLGQDVAVVAGCWRALGLLVAGRIAEADARGARTLALAREIGHPYGVGLAQGLGIGAVRVLGRRGAAALEPAAEVLALAGDHGYPTLKGLGEFLRGAALADAGDAREGERWMRSGAARFAETGHASGRALMLGRLASLLVDRGRAEEGLRVAEEALAVAESTGERAFVPELRRVRAGAESSLGEAARAEELLEAAVEGATGSGALLLALRAAVDLCRLRISAGRTDSRGRELVASLRALVSGPAGAPDLVDADGLLASGA